MQKRFKLTSRLILLFVTLSVILTACQTKKDTADVDFDYTEEGQKKDGYAPDNYEELMNDILELHYNYPDPDEYIDSLNKQLETMFLEYIKEFEINLLQAIWYSGGKIVITGLPLTVLEELEYLKGEATCHDAILSCRPYDEIKGLMTNNKAYLVQTVCVSHPLLNTEQDKRYWCNFAETAPGEYFEQEYENDFHNDMATLMHEVGHLLDYSLAIKEQFSADPCILFASESPEFISIMNEELGNMQGSAFSPKEYFYDPKEYFAENFAVYHGYGTYKT